MCSETESRKHTSKGTEKSNTTRHLELLTTDFDCLLLAKKCHYTKQKSKNIPAFLTLSGGLGEQRRVGEEAAVHPGGRGGGRRAGHRVLRPAVPAAPGQGPELPHPLPPPALQGLPGPHGARPALLPADTCGQLQCSSC